MSEWKPIETALKHQDILFYRSDAGVFLGQFTYQAEWLTEEQQEGLDEDTLWGEYHFAFDRDGYQMCDGDLKPTHWMPLPNPPT